MLQLAVRDDIRVDVLLLVVRVKHLFHLRPEPLLPLEHGLLGDHVGGDVTSQATSEEVMC